MRERAWYDKHRWRLSKGIAEVDYDYYNELKDTQWNPRFEQLMRNRLVLGCLRYGNNLGQKKPRVSKHDLVHSIERRLSYIRKRVMRNIWWMWQIMRFWNSRTKLIQISTLAQ